MHSVLTQFYLGMRTDNRGRKIDEMLAWDDYLLEDVHDYIQWLFPLRVPSNYNPYAPLVTDRDVVEFKRNPALKGKLLQAFRRLLAFYGFACVVEDDHLAVIRMRGYEERFHNWLSKDNHNFLRITRILECLKLLGLPKHATAFYGALAKVYHEQPRTIGKETMEFWRGAE